jgi:hypothetical protein
MAEKVEADKDMMKSAQSDLQEFFKDASKWIEDTNEETGEANGNGTEGLQMDEVQMYLQVWQQEQQQLQLQVNSGEANPDELSILNADVIMQFFGQMDVPEDEGGEPDGTIDKGEVSSWLKAQKKSEDGSPTPLQQFVMSLQSQE